MKTYLKQKEKFFHPKRLFWENPEGPKGPEAEKPIDIKENEKWDIDKMKLVADRIKNLTLTGQIEINKDPKKVDAITFAAALKEALKKDPAMKDIKVNNLHLYLIKGLQENAGLKADDLAALNYNENKGLTEWLQKNNVAKFSIDKGDWLFFDKDGKAIKAESTLAEAPSPQPQPQKPDQGGAVKPAGYKENPYEEPGKGQPQKVERFVLTKEVKEKRDEDKRKVEAAEQETKAEVDRVKPENLEKVSSDVFEFNKDTKLADMVFNLVLFEDKTNAITMGEVESQLIKYINGDPALRGKDNNETFAKFMQRMNKEGYTMVKIMAGRIGFSKKGSDEWNINPLNLRRTVKGAQLEMILYAHENLEKRDQEKDPESKEQKEQKDKSKEKKPTKYDGTEQEVAKIITPKEKAEKGEMLPVDARYLDAMKAILEYKENGQPSPLKLLFNDKPLDCVFKKNEKGLYVISSPDGKVDYYLYNPKKGSPNPLREAQEYYANNFQNGNILKEIQDKNINQKRKFEEWGMVVDAGPKAVNGGGYKYEFDWATGISKDPDVTVKALAHGELEVTVEVSGVGLNGEDKYTFRAGGFQDMIRGLKSLQKYVEAPAEGEVEKKNGEVVRILKEGKDTMRENEKMRRFFERGAAALAGEVYTNIDYGKILKVDSVRAANSLGESKMNQGFYVYLDWMQKLDPPQKLQIVRDLDGRLLATMEPRNLKIGKVETDLPEGFIQIMKWVAESKNGQTLVEGPKQMREKVQKIIDDYNKGSKQPKVSLAGGVDVVGASGSTVQLSREGMLARSFDLPAQMKLAIDQGYLVADNPKYAADKAPTAVDKPKEDKDFTAKAEKSPESIDSGLKKEVFDKIEKQINSPANAPKLRIFVGYKLGQEVAPASVTDDAAKKAYYENLGWKALAKLAEITPAGEVVTEAEQKTIINKIKGPVFRDKFEKESFELFDKKFKELPRLRSAMKGLLESYTYNPNGGTDVDKAMKLYRTKLMEYADTIISANARDKNKETAEAYDQRMLSIFRTGFKTPQQFVEEYQTNLEQAKKYSEYEKANKEFGEGKDSAERAKTIPHEKTFEQWDKEPRAGVGSDAWDLLNATKGVDKANIWLSRLEWNKIGSEKISFNVKYGKEPNQIPLTLHFFKENGRTTVAVSEGWNSKAILPNAKTFKTDAKDDPVARMLEYGFNLNRLEYGEKPADFKVPELAAKPEAPAEGDKDKQPKAPEKAPGNPKEVTVLRSVEGTGVIDEKNKAGALDKILKGQITDTKLDGYLRSYVGFKMAADTPPVTANTAEQRQKYYEPIIWKYLSEISGVKLAGAEANDAEKKNIITKLNEAGTYDKLQKETSDFLGGKFKELPRLSAALKAMVERGGKYDPNGTTDNDKAMVAYKANLIETVESLMKKTENQKKADETPEKYDDRIRLAVKKFVKGPEEFVLEYKKALTESKAKEPAKPVDKPKAPQVAKDKPAKSPKVPKVAKSGGNSPKIKKTA